MQGVEQLERPRELWAAVAGAAALLSACGGGDTLPDAMLETASAQDMRHLLAASPSADTPSPGASVPSATQLMDWAENVYSPFFPSHEPDLRADPFTYRYYPSTQNYLGVAADASGVARVYIFGPISGGVLADVGALADFSERVLAGVAPASDALAARFLSQATLGYTDADIAALRAAGGYRAWLQTEMAKPISTSNWDWLVSKGYDTNANAMTGLAGFDSSIWQRLITAPDGLRQRMALALSEFFVVGVDGVTGNWKPFRMAAYWDLLAANAFGNYRTLLEQVTLSVAMGNYLNMAGNQKENAATGRVPDENYAREVMQLFSIGLVELNLDGTPKLNSQGQPIETYTQDMVTQLARVFTGWDFDRSGSGTTVPEFARKPMVLNANLHSNLAASFLGVTVPANTAGAAALKIALDTLAAHPNVGPFLGKQLIQRLVTSNPSPYYVARVAKVFNDNGQGVRGDLGAVVRAVLLDDEARDPAKLSDPSWGKLREPMLRAIQWARAFKANSLTGNWNLGNTSDPSRSLGQSPQRSPSVFNYFRPGYVPAGSAIGTASLVAPEFQLSNETSVAGYLNAMQNVVGSGHSDVKPNYVSELAVAADANALLDRVVLLLNGTALSTTSRATILGALNAIAATSDTGKANRVYAAVFLVLASPDYLVQK